MIIFRTIIAKLLQEYHLFLQKVQDYKRDAEKLFIQKEESLIYDATSEYADLFRESKSEKLRPELRLSPHLLSIFLQK